MLHALTKNKRKIITFILFFFDLTLTLFYSVFKKNCFITLSVITYKTIKHKNRFDFVKQLIIFDK